MFFERIAIKTFIQQTLGCGCPEKVFEYIDFQSNIRLNNIILKNKINVGNRLLLYIIEINDTSSLENILPVLISSGKKERDSMKFNRFRLVLITDKLSEIEESAESIFEKISKDEKVHLHVVDKKKVPIF
ncbi:MAG: hypothetical protein ACUVUQ_06385 [Thermodesulfovibrionales bacterium]